MKKRITRVCSFLLSFCIIFVVLLFGCVSIADFCCSIKQAQMQQANAIANTYYAKSTDSSGASSASVKDKGGSLFLSSGSNYKMTGGKITGGNKKYGGAIYVSSGATFTMTGGTIESCSASYGGAIYVEAGGTCNLLAGTIRNNTATVNGMDIYIEDGGSLNIEDGFSIVFDKVDIISYIKENYISTGWMYYNTIFRYLEFGSYPQSYVGNTMNQTLESWYKSSSPTSNKSYQLTQDASTGTLNSYKYTDGNYYVRCMSNNEYYNSNYTYINGESMIRNSYAWFKVEPIKWMILNYDDVMNGNATEMNCLAHMALTGPIKYHLNNTDTGCDVWSTSNLRSYLNTIFYNDAFSIMEKQAIKLKTVKNNIVGKLYSSTSDGSGVSTQDYIYCLSQYEAGYTYFYSSEARMCSPTDIAISNNVGMATGESVETDIRPNGGVCSWWTRSSGEKNSNAMMIAAGGSSYSRDVIEDESIRPAISFII